MHGGPHLGRARTKRWGVIQRQGVCNDSLPCTAGGRPGLGQGKTTVVAALARLHARQGRRVRVFKCGPDFLDPHWHQLASGAPVHSLDLWINGAEDCAARLHAAAQEADLVLIEGVMGLFDGDPSAADLARHFGVPVLAVVDASAMAGTLARWRMACGTTRPTCPGRACWPTRGGRSPCRDAAARPARAGRLAGRLAACGAGRWGPAGKPAALLPERHLGLVAAHELPDAMDRLDAAADALAATPLGQMDAAICSAGRSDFPGPPAQRPVPLLLAGRTVAVARDAAFSFIYPANLDTLAQLGARVRFFSPLAGDALPACDAVWLPGGYPELHAAQPRGPPRAAERPARTWAAGKPLWAECGGMLALFASLRLQDGSAGDVGLLPGQAAMQPRLASLGPRQIDLAGQVLRGHSFHYSTADCSAPVLARSSRPGGRDADGEPLYAHGSLRASYFHAWFASNPVAVAQLLGAQHDPCPLPAAN